MSKIWRLIVKKYIDIKVVREIETVLDDITLPVNTGAFQVGDIISITEKNGWGQCKYTV